MTKAMIDRMRRYKQMLPFNIKLNHCNTCTQLHTESNENIFLKKQKLKIKLSGTATFLVGKTPGGTRALYSQIEDRNLGLTLDNKDNFQGNSMNGLQFPSTINFMFFKCIRLILT